MTEINCNHDRYGAACAVSQWEESGEVPMIEVPCDHSRAFRFEPNKTAVVCIDMQRDFLDSRGYAAMGGEDITPLRKVVPNVQRVLAGARSLDMLVIHTRAGYRPDLTDLTPAKQERSSGTGSPVGAPGPMGRLLVRGEYGHDFIDECRPLPGEPVIDKPGFGAFHQTDLQAILGVRGVTHLVIMGVTTQCCVFSTLREAVDRGYWCLTLEDCCGAFSDSLQRGTFKMIASEGHLFGWTSDSRRFETSAIAAVAGTA